jgi:hypothetical protein
MSAQSPAYARSYGLIFVIFEPCKPSPAIKPLWSKKNA